MSLGECYDKEVDIGVACAVCLSVTSLACLLGREHVAVLMFEAAAEAVSWQDGDAYPNHANGRRADDTAMNAEMRETERWNDPAAQFLTVSLESWPLGVVCAHGLGDASDDAIRPRWADYSPRKLTPRRPRSERRVRSGQCTRARGRRIASVLHRDTVGMV